MSSLKEKIGALPAWQQILIFVFGFAVIFPLVFFGASYESKGSLEDQFRRTNSGKVLSQCIASKGKIERSANNSGVSAFMSKLETKIEIQFTYSESSSAFKLVSAKLNDKEPTALELISGLARVCGDETAKGLFPEQYKVLKAVGLNLE